MSKRTNRWDFEADVRRARLGGPSAKVVMTVLAGYAGLDANGAWSCYPSQETIAFEAELSDRQVRRILEDFEHEGLIRRTPRRLAGRNGRLSDLITLDWQAIRRTADQPDIQADKMSGENVVLTGHLRPNQPDIQADKMSGEVKREHPLNRAFASPTETTAAAQRKRIAENDLAWRAQRSADDGQPRVAPGTIRQLRESIR